MSRRHLLFLLGAALVSLGSIRGGWFLPAIWLGFNFLILGFAHARGWHKIFGKQADGTISLLGWLFFLPLLIYTLIVWHLIRLFSREPAQNSVTEKLVVGRRLLKAELNGEFDNIVDLTAEFPEPKVIRYSPAYRNFPILDGAAPAPEALHRAVASLKPGRVFVHCAQGHGRTGLFALAVLLHLGVAHDVEAGLQMLSLARPGIRLSKEQHRCIQIYAAQFAQGIADNPDIVAK